LTEKADPSNRDVLQGIFLLAQLGRQPTKPTLENLNSKHKHLLENVNSSLFKLLVTKLYKYPQFGDTDRKDLVAKYLQNEGVAPETMHGIAVENSLLSILATWRQNKYPHHFQHKLNNLQKISTSINEDETKATITKYYNELKRKPRSGINYWFYFPEKLSSALFTFIFVGISTINQIKSEVIEAEEENGGGSDEKSD